VFATPIAQQENFKVSVTGTATGSIPHEIALKVTQIPGGQLSETTGFVINPENVVQVKQGENITVITSENLKVNNVKVRNVQGQHVNLLPLPNNVWSLQSLVPGVYLLDVIVDMSSSGILGVYETVLVILQPDQTPLPPTSVINQLSIFIETEFSFENDTDQNATEPEPAPAPPSPCYFDPTLEECQPIDGKCPPGFSFNENEQCIPIGKCPVGYGRLDDDETGKCYKNSEIQICPDGYVTHINRECPPPLPPTDEPIICTMEISYGQGPCDEYYIPPGEDGKCPEDHRFIDERTGCVPESGFGPPPSPLSPPTPTPCPLDAEGNEVCPPTDKPSPVPEPPTPECPDAGPELCGEEPPPEEVPPDSDDGINGNGNDNGNGEDGSIGDGEDNEDGEDIPAVH
jgi:hypothetical protein